jgi:hypothetical protein
MGSPLMHYDNINILNDPDVVSLLEGKYTVELQFHSTQKQTMVVVSSGNDHSAVMLPFHDMVTRTFKEVFIETLKQCISLHKYNFEPEVMVYNDPVSYTYDVVIIYRGKKHRKLLTQMDLIEGKGSFEDIINKLVSDIKKEQKEINHEG